MFTEAIILSAVMIDMGQNMEVGIWSPKKSSVFEAWVCQCDWYRDNVDITNVIKEPCKEATDKRKASKHGPQLRLCQSKEGRLRQIVMMMGDGVMMPIEDLDSFDSFSTSQSILFLTSPNFISVDLTTFSTLFQDYSASLIGCTIIS